MNTQKQTYEAPEAQTLVVGFEGMICWSNPTTLMLFSDWGTSDGTGASAGANLIEDAGFNL